MILSGQSVISRVYTSRFGNGQDICIVLVGKTGVGKSASGNTILGERIFVSEARATLVTKQSSFESRMINRKQICVVDTPGLYDTQLSSEEVMNEIVNGIKLAAPGPHVFLLVIAIGRFTKEDRNIVGLIHTTFGREVLRHMMVLFTRADDLEESTIEDYIKEAPELKEVINACTGKYHILNNREKADHTQVDELMKKIEAMIKQNHNRYYSHNLFTKSDELNNAKRSMKEKDADLKSEVRIQKSEKALVQKKRTKRNKITAFREGMNKSSCSIL
ncbi:hypothetical protein cypCar_00002699 [Cyprinus carpio]|nr:hypothetical protein cypCar_00002699 [Cyprinus carpio]